MENIDFEIVTIGGGPAGSSLAIYLKNSGFEVCIIEKKTFPRETLCGEFLSFEVIKSIKELGLFEKFLKLNPNRINSFRFFNNDGAEASTNFNYPAYGIKRGAFDNLLLSSAIDAGITVIQPAEVKTISNENGIFSLVIKDDTRPEFKISSKYLAASYGKQNPLDKNLKRNFLDYKSKLNGVKFHIDNSLVNNFKFDEIHIYAARGIYCGVNAVNDNSVTLCFLEDRSVLQFSPREQLLKLRGKNPKFDELFSCNLETALEGLPVYGTGNIYFGKRKKVENGIFMAGDAAGVIAPLAGDGIGMALESAKLLSRILIMKKAGKINTRQSEEMYENEWDKMFRRRLRTAMLIQNILLKNSFRKTGLIAYKLFPALLPRLVKFTRA